jgi:hypothetical protein
VFTPLDAGWRPPIFAPLMNNAIRHRLVHSLSLTILQQETKKLMNEGWRTIGEPALAAPADIKRPPYWVQAMYLGEEAIPLENQRVDAPEGSRSAQVFEKTAGSRPPRG